MKILLVEDDDNLATALGMRLQSNGYLVNSASDAITAMSKALEFKPDIAVIDINLSRGNGFMVAERLNKSPETNTVPFVFITASRKAGLKEKATRWGAIGFLEKPFYSSQLTDLLDSNFQTEKKGA